MILVAHQPCFCQWLGFFHKLNLADKYINFDQVQYCPKDWINRNRIKTENGFLWLTVPVLTNGHREKIIAEMEINNNTRWREKHWKTIYLAYKKARYFYEYADFFEDLYKRDWCYLIDLNEHLLKWFVKTLGIKTELDDAVNYNFQGTKSNLVLDMCKTLKSDLYIFGGEGSNYAEIEPFKEANIKTYFQKYNHPKYTQLHGEFVSHMSILDLIFNEGPDSLEIIMGGNITKDDLLGEI
jgi:hypothetical protein